mgnify:CR=1 FL=1
MQDKYSINHNDQKAINPALSKTNDQDKLSTSPLNMNENPSTFNYEDLTIDSVYDDSMPSLEQKLIEFLIRKKQNQSID